MTDSKHELRGQVAVVTGGGRGIGAAIARKLAELGATTVVTGRTLQPLEATAEQIRQSGGECRHRLRPDLARRRRATRK